jgi:hypothetical protein
MAAGSSPRLALCALALALAFSPAAAAPFNSCGSGVCFSGNINHHAILQRAPERSAVYGSVNAASPAGAQVVVTLAGTAADGSAYSKDFPTTVGADSTYKALLDAMPAWGSFSLKATCATCAGSPLSVSVVGVTFGDVFLSQVRKTLPNLSRCLSNCLSYPDNQSFLGLVPPPPQVGPEQHGIDAL